MSVKTMIETKKESIIQTYARNSKDTGSSEVQVALLTAHINELNEHFKLYPKDHSSRRGLLKKVGNRRRLLAYLKTTDLKAYQKLIQSLGLRK